MVLLSETASATTVQLGFSEPFPEDHRPTTASQRFDFSEDLSLRKDRNVQVIIKVRPLSIAEVSMQGYGKCVRQESCQCITWTGHPESRFTFDLVADENVSQEKLFKVAGVPMVENCVAGYNSWMFAYGQKVVTGVDELTSELREGEDKIRVVQRDLENSKQLSLEAQERVSLNESKFSALRYSLSSFALSTTHFEQREVCARARLSVSSSCLKQKHEALASVAARKEEIELILVVNQRAEDDLRDKLATL
ncbi:hypothetical protein MLD38_009530 [Melastoma candidum]|uniref:Uncharacterized protein n=1 Tax=Melastoma candidum TaxID=119954 RepID=A0ACB9RXJ2_9MYRT|nr:hypothetical protein MLD38_009530 [Melastoma candidum]